MVRKSSSKGTGLEKTRGTRVASTRSAKPATSSKKGQTDKRSNVKAGLGKRAEAAILKSASDPLVVAAKAELLAFNDVHKMLTARANGCGKPPSILRKTNGRWMICYLQSDCTYGQCEIYTGPAPASEGAFIEE